MDNNDCRGADEKPEFRNDLVRVEKTLTPVDLESTRLNRQMKPTKDLSESAFVTEPRQLFEILARENSDMLMVYLRSVVQNSAAVDDLFQETLLTAWRNIERFDRTRPFAPWLRGIAGKLILAWRRKSAGNPRLCDEDVLEQLDQRMSQFQRLSGDTFDEKLEALRDCLRGLPETYRHVVELRYQQAMTPARITEELCLNGETVKKRLQRARSMLLDCVTSKLIDAGEQA